MKERMSKEDFNILYLLLWKSGPKVRFEKPDSWINQQPELFSDLPNWTPTKKPK